MSRRGLDFPRRGPDATDIATWVWSATALLGCLTILWLFAKAAMGGAQ